MDILTIAFQKGLAGRTTLTAHLAVEAERTGAGPVAVMGTDPQDSMVASRNQPASEILPLLPRMSSGGPDTCTHYGASASTPLRYARAYNVEHGGYCVAQSAAINVWSHHWGNAATREASEIIGTFDVCRVDTPVLWEIETDEEFALEDLMAALGRLELQALGSVKHGDVPPAEG